jgi:hypothetical protein
VEKAKGDYIQSKTFCNPNFSVSYNNFIYDPALRRLYDDNNTQFSTGINWNVLDISHRRFYSIQASIQEYLFKSSLRDIIAQFISVFFQALQDKEYLEYLKSDLSDYIYKKQELGNLSYLKLKML